MMSAAYEARERVSRKIRQARGARRVRLMRHEDRLWTFARECFYALHPEERIGYVVRNTGDAMTPGDAQAVWDGLVAAGVVK